MVPPAIERIAPSASKSCSKRVRLEPSAARRASSRRRAAVLLSTRFATLAHVTSSTSPTAPSRSNSGRWSGPGRPSRSGIATKPIEKFWFRAATE